MKIHSKSQGGFSLLELSVVLIISGLLFALAVSTYKGYYEKEKIYATQTKLDSLAEAMDKFFATYGYYPCPASYSAKPGDSNFGVSTDCYNAATVAVNSCGNENGTADPDYCVSQVTKTRDGVPIALRIRKGTIPFQTLKEGIGWNVDETAFTGPAPYGIKAGSHEKKYLKSYDIGAEDAVDTNKNRFTYALTEIQGTKDYFPRSGGIDILNENGFALSTNADYVMVGHGDDAGGSYSFFGDAIAGGCPATMAANEQENCDNNNVYVSSLRYDDPASPLKFDDVLLYRSWTNYYLWDVSENNAKNIYNLNLGSVGIGTKTPVAKVHVFDGNVLADQVAERRNSAGFLVKPAGNIMAKEYCAYNATGGVDCFLPEKIGGTGMDCDVAADNVTPVGAGPKMMRGIQTQKVECEKIYDSSQTAFCPPGEFPRGFNYNYASKTLTVTGCKGIL